MMSLEEDRGSSNHRLSSNFPSRRVPIVVIQLMLESVLSTEDAVFSYRILGDEAPQRRGQWPQIYRAGSNFIAAIDANCTLTIQTMLTMYGFCWLRIALLAMIQSDFRRPKLGTDSTYPEINVTPFNDSLASWCLLFRQLGSKIECLARTS